MDYDMLLNKFRELLNPVIDVFKGLIEDIVYPFMEILKELKSVEFKKKKKFIPVMRIKAKKINLYDKRFRTYYCRNSC